jgi:hypothetical protein
MKNMIGGHELTLALADAEHAADDAGMILSNLDLSYLGIYSIWTNYLGMPRGRLGYWKTAVNVHR